MQPSFEVQIRVQKPLAAVFEAVVDPAQLSRYFVQEASARPTTGSTVQWRFAEDPGVFPVSFHEVTRDQRVAFSWGSDDGTQTRVEFTFTELAPDDTRVTVRESGWKDDAAGRKASYGNCGGWMHMLCCLKAWLEYGINLRAGSVG